VTQIDRVNLLKEKGLTGMCVATHWLARRVQPLKQQVHQDWEYSGLQDQTRETQENIAPEHLVKHLGEILQDISSWPADEQVRPYHIAIERDPIRHLTYFSLHCFSMITYFNFLKVGLG
jgi:hypothetical protein